jgi:putative DNA primase/helicase
MVEPAARKAWRLHERPSGGGTACGFGGCNRPDADDAKRIATAQRLWKASAPVAGTLGEHYLTVHRGIRCPSHGWPEAVRFHPGSRALIVAATLLDGTVQAVQRVLLTAEGAKISREDAERLSPPTNKVTNGVQVSAAIRLPALLPDAPLLLAEGPETGLSVWAATGAETWVALGSMSRAAPTQRQASGGNSASRCRHPVVRGAGSS